jgi:hypothetical protein
MDKIKFRDLQRWSLGDIEKVVPVTVTSDSQAKLVVLSYESYNKIINTPKLAPRDSQGNLVTSSQEKEPEHYIIKRVNGGLVKQETDLDGYPIYD